MEIYLNPLGVAVCTSGSDPGGLRSARREGAIPLSITVSTAGSNPAGVGSTPNRGYQAIRSEIVCKSFYSYPVGRRIRSVHLFKEWCDAYGVSLV